MVPQVIGQPSDPGSSSHPSLETTLRLPSGEDVSLRPRYHTARLLNLNSQFGSEFRFPAETLTAALGTVTEESLLCDYAKSRLG
jgi:hypothetical protein